MSAGVQPPAGADDLSTYSTGELVAEIARRHRVTGPLRLALDEADPAALTREDRAALLDLLDRSFAAAGVQ